MEIHFHFESQTKHYTFTLNIYGQVMLELYSGMLDNPSSIASYGNKNFFF